MFNFNDVSNFIEIAKAKNLTKAAGRIGVSQPSLSMSMQRLEEAIGCQVFLRSKKGVILTRQGELFYQRAMLLIGNWQDLIKSVSDLSSEVSGKFVIGCHPSVGLYTLHKLVPQLSKNHNLKLELVYDLSRIITQKVIDFEIDLGLVINPQKHGDLVLYKVLDDEVCLWRHKSFEDDHPKLIIDNNLLQSKDILRRINKSKKINTDNIIDCPNLENITKLTMAKVGYGIIPSRVVAEIDQRKSLVKVESLPIFKDELYLCYRVENKNFTNFKEITKIIKKAI
ncbi:LysR family transcriptional regulator [Bacteriovoracaceae bacterium]|nr:LysR family transcriptional regulator [Bacteriovoracaceae bacterium]